MSTIALSVGMWFAKIALRSALKKVSATLQDKLQPVAAELVTAAAETSNTADDKIAAFFAAVVGAEE